MLMCNLNMLNTWSRLTTQMKATWILVWLPINKPLCQIYTSNPPTIVLLKRASRCTKDPTRGELIRPMIRPANSYPRSRSTHKVRLLVLKGQIVRPISIHIKWMSFKCADQTVRWFIQRWWYLLREIFTPHKAIIRIPQTDISTSEDRIHSLILNKLWGIMLGKVKICQNHK